jgi:hypothetical protein
VCVCVCTLPKTLECLFGHVECIFTGVVRFPQSDSTKPTPTHTYREREKKELGVRERRVSGGGCGSADGGEENQPRFSKHWKSHREVACRLLLVNAKLERQSATAFFRCEQVSLMDDVVT